MKPRIAIPLPTSTDPDYNLRAWPIYAEAIGNSGGHPVEIPLNASPAPAANLINTCQAVLLPGSPADANPHKYGQDPIPECNPADPSRENVDELLIQDAHNLHKPIFAICFGAQSLNVWRGGTLVQHLAPMPVNHPAGAASPSPTPRPSPPIPCSAPSSPSQEAPEEAPEQDGFLRLPVNSSHHQAIGIPGDGLRVTARCPQDAVIEAVEGGQATQQHATSSSASSGTPSAATTSAPPPAPSSTASSPKPPPGPPAPSAPRSSDV